jgi:hypothetical protein
MVLCREEEESAAMCHPNLLEQRYVSAAVGYELYGSNYILCLMWAPFILTVDGLALPGLLIVIQSL